MKLLVGWLAIGVAGFSWLPSHAQACSCSPQSIYWAAPADGAQGVPLNSAIEILGAFESDSIAVVDAQGQAVDFTLHAGPTPSCEGTAAEIVPKQPLRPNTAYVLSVRGLYPDLGGSSTLSFTTGTELLPDEDPEPPRGAASVVFDVPADGFSCGDGPVATCMSVERWENVEVVARRGDETLFRWVMSTDEGVLKLAELPDCLELRRRTATGRRSAPLKLCGDALKTRGFQASDGDSENVLFCAGGLFGRSAASDGTPDGPSVTSSEPAGDRIDVSSSKPSDAALAPEGSMKDGCSLASDGPRASFGALFVSIAMMLVATRRGSRRVLKHQQTD